MTGGSIVRYLKTWAFKRQEQQRRLNELRRRDGDNCRRCRRPLRFDLPEGHDRAPTVQAILSDGAASALDNLCLCHTRCNAELGDNTAEVRERVQRRQEAAMWKPKRKRSRAA
jgi:hypothetical protein